MENAMEIMKMPKIFILIFKNFLNQTFNYLFKNTKHFDSHIYLHGKYDTISWIVFWKIQITNLKYFTIIYHIYPRNKKVACSIFSNLRNMIYF